MNEFDKFLNNKNYQNKILQDAKLKEGQEVYLNIDSSKISLIGEDHVSIFDKNTKQITLEKYQIKSN